MCESSVQPSESSVKSRLSMQEMETILRFDRTSEPALAYTASPAQAAKWRRLGWTVIQDRPHAWYANVPKNAITLRKLVDGQTVKRRLSESSKLALQGKRRSKNIAASEEVGHKAF